jgi:hypothetical protein
VRIDGLQALLLLLLLLLRLVDKAQIGKTIAIVTVGGNSCFIVPLGLVASGASISP